MCGMADRRSVELTCHPSMCGDAVRGIAVDVRRSTDGALALTFRLAGALARIRVPAPRAPRIGDQLWEHTCFEAFIGLDGTAAYHELNFAPSGEWAASAFHSYRDFAGPADTSLAPRIAVCAAAEWVALDAVVRLDRLSPRHPRAPLRLGLSAVIEATDGARSYWALRHPAGRPDFHHADAWALRLEPPATEW